MSGPVADDPPQEAGGELGNGPQPPIPPPGGPGRAALGTGTFAYGPPAGRVRRIWVRAIILLATLLAVLAIFAIWADRQLLSPTNWANTSTELLSKSSIRTAVAGYLVDRLYANVDVPGELKSGLPTQLKPLAGPLSGALHGVAEQGAQRALDTPQLQNVWRTANRAADETLVRIVNGGGSHVGIRGGTVSLNLRQIVADLSRRLGLPASIATKLPESVANLRIVTSSQLGLVRNLAKALHALAVWLAIVSFVLYGLALFLASGERRRTLLLIGWSLVLAGIVVIVARRIAEGQLVSAITTDAAIEPAAEDAYLIATSLLVRVANSSIIIGVPLILSAWFAGPARWAVAGRRFLAPIFRERPTLPYWVTAGLLALIFIWGPVSGTRSALWALLLTVLALLGVHELRGRLAQEFPDVRRISMGAALRQHAHALGETIARMRAVTAPERSTAAVSKTSELERLAALHERGALTDDEYTAAKQELLPSRR